MLKAPRLLVTLFTVCFASLAPRLACADGAAAAPPAHGEDTTEVKYFPALENGVPGSYLVRLYSAPAASAAPELMRGVGGKLGYIFKHIFSGFMAELTEDQAIHLAQDPLVRKVVQDAMLVGDETSTTPPHCYGGYAVTTATSFPPLPGPSNPEPTQSIPCSDTSPAGDCIDNWGLDRIDQFTPMRDAQFSYRQKASAVKIYTLDTGVYAPNREFLDAFTGTSRVGAGIWTGCTGFPFGSGCNTGNISCPSVLDVAQGHGTHVAAIIGGRTFGLAKDVDLVPIRTLCPFTPISETLLGLDWVLGEVGVSDPTVVVNISGMNAYNPNGDGCTVWDTSCPYGEDLQDAMVSLAARDNIFVVQSAGNKSFTANPAGGFFGLVDACDYSFGDENRYPTTPTLPSGISERQAISRIVVAAGSDETDGLWRTMTGEIGDPAGSNQGPCVDVFAPAARIVSAYRPPHVFPSTDLPKVYCELSGTSMAAPHVAGVAAMILETAPMTPSKGLKQMILRFAQNGVLHSIGGTTPNRLLHWDPSDIASDGFETGDYANWEVSP